MATSQFVMSAEQLDQLKTQIIAELTPKTFEIPPHETRQITVTCTNPLCLHNQRWDDDGAQIFQTDTLDVPVTEGRDDFAWTGVICGGCGAQLHTP